MDFGCHRIEVLLNLLGDITAIQGLTAKIYPQHDVEDVAAVLWHLRHFECSFDRRRAIADKTGRRQPIR